MRDFSKISPALWRSKRFNGLVTAEEKLVFLYLLTCEHQNSAGAFRLPAGYAATDLRITEGVFAEARDSLVKADLIAFDPDTDEYVILRWFKHNPPMNEKHRVGIIALLEKLDSEGLLETALNALHGDKFSSDEEEAERQGTSSDAYGDHLTETGIIKRFRR